MKTKILLILLFSTVILLPIQAQNKIIGYQYAFNNGENMQFVSIAPTTDFHLNTDINVSSLSNIINTIHIRFLDQNGKWSSILSRLFIKPLDGDPTSDVKIVGYEYYFNNDTSNIQSIAVTPSNSFHLISDIPVGQLSAIINTINIRFKDSQGKWSPTISKLFIKPLDGDPTSDVKIVGYEYYFNNDTSNIQSIAVTPSNSFHLVTDLDVNALPHDLNTFNIRFKDSQGKWSPMLQKVFFRPPNITQINRKIVAYEYWVQDDTTSLREVTISPSVDDLNIVNIDVRHIWQGQHILHTRFKDSDGKYSSVTTDTITKVLYPYAQFTVNQNTICTGTQVNFINNSVDYDTVLWNFGDNTTSTDYNPTHVYTQAGTYQVTLLVRDSASGQSNQLQQNIVVYNTPVNTTTISQNLPACFNDTVTLTADANNANYLWSTGDTTKSIKITAAGNYSVQISNATHSSCADTSNSIQVSYVPQIDNTITISGNIPVCYNDTIILTANASNTEYLWSTGDTTKSILITAAGNYSVQLSDSTYNYCLENSNPIQVDFVPMLDTSIAISGMIPVCYADTLTLTANANSANYLWSNGDTTKSIQVTNAGNYSVQISDSSYTYCNAQSNAIQVDFVPMLDSTITIYGNNPSCYGDTVVLVAATQNNVGYLWSDGDTAQGIKVGQSGNYSVTITSLLNPGCNISSSVNISYLPQIDTSVTINHYPPQLIANQSGAIYQWRDCNNNMTAIAGQTNQTFVPNHNGAYAVEITMYGCIVTSDCQIVAFMGMEDMAKDRVVRIYPNPTESKLTIDSKEKIYLEIFNLTGQKVFEIENTHGKNQININNLSNGTYYIRFIIQSGDLKDKVFVYKFIKTN